MRRLMLAIMVLTALTLGCSFSEYSQSAALPENIDDYRTGCEIDADRLIAGYNQYDANRFHFLGPTPTPDPITDRELTAKLQLEMVWENGCQAGRRDVVGAEQATIMNLRDQLRLFEERIAALELTPQPTPNKEGTDGP